jgi:hypothetical protein
MTIEVKQILKPKSVETAEDEMPDRLKSSDISSEIDFLKRIKLKAQILQSAQALQDKPGFQISKEDVAAASFESQEDKRKKKFYSQLITLYNKTTSADGDIKLAAKKDLAYLYSVYGMKDLYELACDLSNIERTSETNKEATEVASSILK